MAQKLEAVIFDWAGTTMDYGCKAPVVTFQQVFAEKGVPISIEEARGPMGANKKIHIRKITEMYSVRERWFQKHNQYPTQNDVEAMFTAFVPAQMAVLADYADLIPGTLETIQECRNMGLTVGSTTGYTGEMMHLLIGEAIKRGYTPHVSVCSTGDYAIRRLNGYQYHRVQGMKDDFTISRPEPFMCELNQMVMGVKDSYACVKVGDTLDDIREGYNAGMWTIGLAKTGNEIGLNLGEINSLSEGKLALRLSKAYTRMFDVGADYVVETIAEVPEILRKINALMDIGKTPGRGRPNGYRKNILLED